MSQKKINILVVVAWLILCGVIIFVADLYTHKKMNQLTDKILAEESKHMRTKVEFLILKKKDSMLPLGLALAQNSSVKDALLQKNPKLLQLDTFSLILKNKTRYQNVWFQVIDTEGNSLYRSWTAKQGDNLLKARTDIAQMLQEPKIMSSISTGKFDMTIKEMVPVYDQGRFIGMIEILTHFNSIAQELRESGVDAIFLVDKKYKKQLIHPFTQLFIEDYYIANYNADSALVEQVKNDGIEKYLGIDEGYLYTVNSKQLMTIFKIFDLNGHVMSYVILSKYLNERLNFAETAQLHQDNFVFIILLLLIISILGYLIVNMKYSTKLKANYNQLKFEKEKITTIINTQPAIIMITDGQTILETNLQFFEFFDSFSSLEEFQKEYRCICNLFYEIEDPEYLVNDARWLERILNKQNKPLKVAMLKNNVVHHFLVAGKQQSLDPKTTINIISFFDITEQIQKDNILLRQSKSAAMGEMIDAIAHQWKTPLGIIKGYAEFISMDMSAKKFDPDEIKEFSDKIIEQSNHLHETLAEFRSFFRPNASLEDVSLESLIEFISHILKDQLIKNQITLVSEHCKDVTIKIIPNEFKHVLINLISNSIDAYNEKGIEGNREIVFEAKKEDKGVVLKVSDSAGGIPEGVIEHIFESNFTTKVEGKGTGIGLYMTKQILDKIGAEVEVYNTNQGVCFEIKIKTAS